jgi:gluconolactonase
VTARVTPFRDDVAEPEGPVALEDGGWLFTEMARGTVCRVDAAGARKTVIAQTGRPSGLALDGPRTVWVAESRFPALLRLALDGERIIVTTGPDELPFLWPNDVCVGMDGAVYLTDSGATVAQMEAVQASAAFYDLDIDGRVYRVDPHTGACEVLDRGLRFANGIAIGPEGALYVSETLTGNVYVYDPARGGERRLFANVMLRPPIEHGRVAGPDGMAFDADGRLYVACLVQGDITVLEPDGALHARIQLPGDFPTNVAFAAGRARRALVTEGARSRLLMLETDAPGLA